MTKKDEELEDLEDHAFDMAMSHWLEQEHKEYSITEAEDGLNQIAKEYNLKLCVLSDFKIARALWAKSLKRTNYD